MKIPVVAIKKIVPYIRYKKIKNSFAYHNCGEYQIYLEIELTEKWKNIFLKFEDKVKVQLKYNPFFRSFNNDYGRVYGVTIKDFGPSVPTTFYKNSEKFSINFFTRKYTKNRVVRCIKRLKFGNKKDLARIKMVSKI